MEWQEKTGAPAEYLRAAYDPKTKQAEGLVIHGARKEHTMNCTEQLLAYARARIRREKLYEMLFAATIGAIIGTLFAIGMKR